MRCKLNKLWCMYTIKNKQARDPGKSFKWRNKSEIWKSLTRVWIFHLCKVSKSIMRTDQSVIQWVSEWASQSVSSRRRVDVRLLFEALKSPLMNSILICTSWTLILLVNWQPLPPSPNKTSYLMSTIQLGTPSLSAAACNLLTPHIFIPINFCL